MFKSSLKTCDYPDDINATNYLQWIRSKLVPDLPPQPVFVTDNASYHNVLSVKFRKDGEKLFHVDSVLSEHGHTVLRLPSYHPELSHFVKALAFIKSGSKKCHI